MVKPTDAEVERVAKAMMAAQVRFRRKHRLPNLLPFSDMNDTRQQLVLETARAAIKALQKPRRRQGE